MNPKRIAAVVALLLLSLPFAAAKTIIVGKDMPVKTITHAVYIAQPYDSIVVNRGLYLERVNITKPVVLKGVGEPTVDARKSGTVITVSCSGVSIEGFRIVNSARSSLRDYCGILCKDSRCVSIKNNVMRSDQFSIMMQNCVDCRITGNSVESDIMEMQVMGNAIHCWKCDSIYIAYNRVGHNRDGIYLEFVYNSLIEHNEVSECERYGLHFMFSHHNVYRRNRFYCNLAGVAVMYTHDVQMYENIFEQNRGGSSYGLLLKDISHGEIKHNTFSDNTMGILMDGGTNLRLSANLFRGNGWAIRVVASSMNDTIVSNSFIGNTFDISTNSSYNSNTFDGNYWDKYSGYDLDKDGVGDTPHHPLSLFSMLAERNSGVLLFFKSILMNLMEQSERLIPSITPDNYSDNTPLMKPTRI